MKKIINITILFIIIILIIVLIIKLSKKELFVIETDEIIYYDENNNIIDNKTSERDEQEQSYKYIDASDVVLELGARYGTVSNVINYKLNNKENHIIVEPDETVLKALEKNRDSGNFKYKIETKYISNNPKEMIKSGYGTRLVNSNNPNNNNITWNDFKKKYPLKFNVIVADCEGCLCEFIETMGEDFNNIYKIIFEEDQAEMCNYTLLKEKLIENGFKKIEEVFSGVNRCVYIKK